MLGEIRGWWSSSVRHRRLDLLFPRTHVLAQIGTLVAVAARHHDGQALPRQKAYHLFRLAPSREIELADPTLDLSVLRVPDTEDEALAMLDQIAIGASSTFDNPTGPLRLGEVRRLQHAFEPELAACYRAAARAGTVVVPYYEG